MFKHILLAIDDSTYSQEALPAAIEVATRFNSEIIVLHVSEHDRGRAVVYSLETPAHATALVFDAVKKLRDRGVAATGQLRDVASGHVAKTIVETAAANGVDLVVTGSRGLSDMQALMVGSVSHEVMRAAATPKLVVRPVNKALATNGLMLSVKA